MFYCLLVVQILLHQKTFYFAFFKPANLARFLPLCKHALNGSSQVYLVCNADKFKHFERWATGNDFPLENIINDGTTRYA
jgi:hypothetical protein